MIAALGQRVSRVFQAIVPDPFAIAIGLTVLTGGIALAFGSFAGLPADHGLGARAAALVDAWSDESTGLWRFLKFGMQMCLILVTGYALAASGPVSRGLDAITRWPATPRRAVWLVATTAATLGLVNWGLSLMAGAILASRMHAAMRERGVGVPLPLLAAAGYLGLLTWHGGLSGTAPFSMTTAQAASSIMPAAEFERLAGGGLALTRTVLSPINLVASGGVVLLAPLVLAALTPATARVTPAAPPVAAPQSAAPAATGFVGFVERSPIVPCILAALLVVVLVRYGGSRGWLRPGLNEVNAAMLAIGLVAHGSLRSYVAAAERGAAACVGIILQFPLYGGIMGMMAASGLAAGIAGGLAGLSTPQTMPLFTFASAAVLNLFVPSGGGQWAIQGPIVLEAGAAADADPALLVLAVAYGDQLTNMLQPFWALPLLTITGASARDVVGYTALVMLAAAAWIGGCLVVAGVLSGTGG
ncbi:MAG: TIGR00366 family protein [Planctomycetota bacterium]